VHRNTSLCTLANAEKLVNDPVRGRGAIFELKIMMRDASVDIGRGVVGAPVIESDDSPDVLAVEDIQQVLRLEGEVACLRAVRRSLEGKELARNDFMHISILGIVVVKILALPPNIDSTSCVMNALDWGSASAHLHGTSASILR
jgi:hypothetical protein